MSDATKSRTRGTRARAAAIVGLALTTVLATLMPAAPALAANQSVLDVEITAVDYSTGVTQTEAAYGTHGNRVAYRVDFSCGVEACLNTTVSITPPQSNPYGITPTMNSYLTSGGWSPNLLTYDTWTAPVGLTGTSIGGDDVTGKVVSLGDVPAGFAGSFLVVYDFPPGNMIGAIIPAQLYPAGFEIVHSATIASPNAPLDASDTADPVLWGITVPSPSIVIGTMGTVRPDVNVTYQVRMTSGAMGRSSGNIWGRADLQAAGNHTVTFELPDEAVYVSSTGSPAGVYDPITHSVTWTIGTEATPDICAGGGWGSTTQTSGYWNQWPPCYQPRNVTVTYPASEFTSDPSGCNFDANVTASVSVDMTYLDAARTEKTASATSTHSVSCYDPFGRVAAVKDSTHDGGSYPPAIRPVNIPPVVTGLVCDSDGYDDWGRACTPGDPLAPYAAFGEYWSVYSYNRGNVPGVATVADTNLDLPGMPVYRINATATTPTPTIAYTYQCGTDPAVSGSIVSYNLVLSTLVGAATGCRFTEATVTSGTLAAGNVRPTDNNTGTLFQVNYFYTVSAGVTPGQRTNTATTTMTYPGTTELDGQSFPAVSQRVVNLQDLPTTAVVPRIAAAFPSAYVVDGGGQAVPGRDVTFSVNGVTTRFSGETDYAPQYTFVAPVGWVIEDGSASFAASIPAGVTFEYRTVEIEGEDRDVVVASWPDGTTFGENVTLPTMTVVATPTYAVAAGTTSIAWAWLGDSRDEYDNLTAEFVGARQDTGDADDDGSTVDWVSQATQSVLVSAAAGVTVTKEICLPDTSPDGCDWISDPSQPVPVSLSASDIQYRVTIMNSGNTTLTGVVGYDVLPFPGDTGTSDAASGTPRGSTFTETLVTIDDQTAGLDLTYSLSTNPPRPEVYSGATSGDWTAPVADAQAIRAAYSGNLLPGESVFFSYSADVGDEAAADSLACNSVAVDTSTTVPSEPPAVCAITAEADLEITVPSRLPLQEDRPGVIPFLVTNNGPSAAAPATVSIDIPSGVTVTSLTPAGWDCTDSGAAPLAGPVTIECSPVDAGGAPTTLPEGTPVALDLAVRPDAPDADLCIDADVASTMFDSNPSNNDTTACFVVADLVSEIEVEKTDSRSTVAIGDEYDYTISVSNGLVGEDLPGTVLIDELPDGLVFVAASDGGTVSGQNPDGSGGTVTWPAVDLDLLGVANADGDGVTGSGGVTTYERTVTVRVAATATGTVDNVATASASDPADSALTLEDSATDSDDLRRVTVSKTSDALPAGVRAGQIVEYTVTVLNDGTADYGTGDLTVVDDLSGVLDDAEFVSGSGSALIGATQTPVADPSGGVLTWVGALAVGESVTLSYEVEVGDGSAGDRVLANTAFGAGAVDACVDGQDPDGISCATTSSPFAPVIDKRVADLQQSDDGEWMIVYEIDVTNLDDSADVTYDLSDDLAFGAGITPILASVSLYPGAVTPEAWAGSGLIVNDAVIPAGDTHTYEVTVYVDAGSAAGTAAALCLPGVASGFANVATLGVAGSTPVEAEACASPVAPSVAKSVATPTQRPDGTWDVVYTVTVTNPHTAPAGGLAYFLDDVFTVPAGVDVLDVAVVGPAGASIDPAFDGSADVTPLMGAESVPAAVSSTVPTTRVYTFTFHTSVPAGSGSASTFACPPAGTGGYANTVTLFAGDSSTVVDEADACAAVAPLPTPEVTKTVTSSSIDAGTGNWTIAYEIVVTNPSADFSTVYTLEDELTYAADATVVSAAVASTDAPVSGTWDGVADLVILSGQSLPAGASDVFTVTVVVDPSAVDVESAAADCRVDAGETGTGFRNVATVTAGASTVFADACEPATDPSVVKTVTAPPTQNPATGVWTVEYQVSVTNRSTTTVVGGIPYVVEDELDFAPGVSILDVATSTVGGSDNALFDGVLVTVLGTGSIEAAADETTPEVHTYTVTVQFTVEAGVTVDTDCSPTDGVGGLLNVAEITVGGRVSGDAACADVPDVPLPGVTKTVTAQEQLADGTWQVTYEIVVGNPGGATVEYDLDDELTPGAGITVVGAPDVTAVPAGVTAESGWDGDASIRLAEDILLPGGGSHTYAVTAVFDTGSLTGSDTAADCVLDAGETGTGFGNRATVGSSSADATAETCATISDPAVTKTVNGVPVQQADGSWLVGYTMTVTNPSAFDLSYGLEDELDFPAGSTITVESAAARPGGPTVESTWDGQTELTLVAAGTSLPASAIHVFDVTLRAVLPTGQGSQTDAFSNTVAVQTGPGGVVESTADAAADLEVPELDIVKRAIAATVTRIGDTVDYEVEIENVGLGDFTALYPAVVWDDMSGVLDDATLTSAVVATPNTGTIATSGERFSWRGALPAGSTVILTYTVEIVAGGDASLHNVAFPASPTAVAPATPDPCSSVTGCVETRNSLPAILVEKSVSATRVAPGDVLEYEVTVTNTGDIDIPTGDPIVVEDDLAGVLADATYRNDAAADLGTVTVTGGVLTWTGGLTSGEVATITYSVLVDPDAADGATLVNTVVADPTLLTLALDGTPAAASATTTTPVARMALTGADGIPIILLSALALLFGGALLLLVRRRRAEA